MQNKIGITDKKMQNILTNLVRVQHERYGSDREAFSLVDVAGKKCISTTWGEFRRDVDNMACALEILGPTAR